MKLQAQKRTVEEKLHAVRNADMIPAVCYGPDQEAFTVSLNQGEFSRVFREVGSSAIIDLEVDNDSYEVLVKQVDRDPVYETVLHVDFYAIKRGEEMQLVVPIVFEGESPAAKSGAVLNEVMHELEVRCLPRNIPAEIVVDLSVLTESGMSITIGDLTLGEGVAATADEHDAVVLVSEATEEAEGSDEDAQAAVDAVLADKTEEE